MFLRCCLIGMGSWIPEASLFVCLIWLELINILGLPPWDLWEFEGIPLSSLLLLNILVTTNGRRYGRGELLFYRRLDYGACKSVLFNRLLYFSCPGWLGKNLGISGWWICIPVKGILKLKLFLLEYLLILMLGWLPQKVMRRLLLWITLTFCSWLRQWETNF